MSAPDRRTRRLTGAWLAVSAAGSLGLLVAYWGGAGTQAEGATLAVALGGLALAAGTWGIRVGAGRVAVEQRELMPSTPEQRRAVSEDVGLDAADPGRRRGLLALLGLAGAGLVAALVSPLRSLGPRPLPARERTGWRAGRRLVDADGAPVTADDLDVGSIATVFPEGDEERADSQVVLVRLRGEGRELPDDRRDPAPDGHVAYSKICTHAGCPVGLYDPERQELFCPCHQSVFLAAEGARPGFGPAPRALPELPLGVDDDGYLVARGDFPEPVGPSYWSRP